MGNRHRATSLSYGVSAEEQERSLKSIAHLKLLHRELKYEWSQLASGDLTPLEMAIAFLDDTLVGMAHRKPSFDALCENFGSALRAAVVDNHEIFNNSAGLYHILLRTAQDSQKQAETIGYLIESSTQDMRTRTAFLRELDANSIKYSETIELLDAMARMSAIPSEVERLIGEKKIHNVYDVIAQGYETAAKYNLWSLSAMALIQNFLEVQLHTLYDMIIEEVKNEIYLRNFASVKNAWLFLFSTSSPSAVCWSQLLNSTTLEQSIHNLANADVTDIADRLSGFTDVFLQKLLPKLHHKSSTSELGAIDYSVLLDSALNSYVELYFYLYRLFCTATKLNKLDMIVSVLLTSLRLEIQVLISRVTEETKLGKLGNLQRLTKLQETKKLDQVSIHDKLNSSKLYDAAIPVLHDLFFSVFVACLTVLQRHRVTWEIVKLIKLKESFFSDKRDSISLPLEAEYSFEKTWRIVLEELRALVATYIDEAESETKALKIDGSNASYGGNDDKIHKVLMKKQLFSFEEADPSAELSQVSQKLTQAAGVLHGFDLRKAVGNGVSIKDTSPYISSEHFNSSVHVLVPQTVFNMRVVLEHFLVFVSGAQRLFVGSSSLSSKSAQDFFLDVLKNVFLVRFREEVDIAFVECIAADSHNSRSGFGQAVVALSSDSLDVSNLQTMLSPHRVYLNAVQFRHLFVSLCYIINTSFSYRKDMSGLVLSLLTKFSKSYTDYHEDLLTTGGTQDITEIQIGAVSGLQTTKPKSQVNQWMRIPDLLQSSGQLLGALTADSTVTDVAQNLVQKEIVQMFSASKAFDHSKEDILDDEWFHHVCYLVLTSLWVLLWLPMMRKESNYNVCGLNESKTSTEDVENLKFEFSFLDNGRPSAAVVDRMQKIYLTLSLDKIVDFDTSIKAFESIRNNALIALRYDIRLKSLYHIEQSFEETFVLSIEPADCDPFILLFNKEIYFIGTKVQDLLTPSEIDCVFCGLPQFINRAFIQGSELIKVVNGNGIKKILLNIFTTQQVLRTVMKKEDTVDLSNASKYYELFTVNEKLLLEKLNTDKIYTQSEVLDLVRLIYSEKLNSTSVSHFNRTMYADLVARIKELYK